jgi:hypothetical protein
MTILLGCLFLASSGCYWGMAGIYGCTGEQTRREKRISCPACGNSQVDRLRVKASLLPWVAFDPLIPLATHEYFCPSCKTWWGTGIFDLMEYEYGPGWPWKSKSSWGSHFKKD